MHFCSVFFLASVLQAQTPNQLTGEQKAAGWILLFDGKTMAGWDAPLKKNPPGNAWTVEDGCLKANRNPRIREDLLTQRSFRDFELEFDWRISAAGNSGVKYRIQDRVLLQKGKTKPGARRFEETVDYEYAHRLAHRNALTAKDTVEDYPIAFEYQVIDNEGHPDAKRGDKQTAGALYSMIGPTAQTARPIQEFNHSRLILLGNHVEHWLNDVKVVDTDLDSPAIEHSLVSRWGKNSPVYKLLMTQPKKDCPIGLQNHNDEVWFRNIRIRPL